MSRRRPAAPDSLELLLDTLCNTFGGVLFIAMLVVLLLQMSGQGQRPEAPTPVAATTLDDLKESLAVLRTEIDALAAIAQGHERLVDPSVGRAIKAMLADLDTARARHDRATNRRDQLLIELGRREARVRRIGAEMRKLDTDLASARDERTASRNQAARERAARSRPVRSPVIHSTLKPRVGVIVRFGRLYVWHRYGPDGERLGLNVDEFVVVEETHRGLITTPRPTAGISLDADPSLKLAVGRRLVAFPPDRWCLDIVVHHDSFQEFGHLKRSLAELGYEYSLLLLAEGHSVIDRGGEDHGVQ